MLKKKKQIKPTPHLSPNLVQPCLPKSHLSPDHGGGKDAELGHLSHAELAACCPAEAAAPIHNGKQASRGSVQDEQSAPSRRGVVGVSELSAQSAQRDQPESQRERPAFETKKRRRQKHEFGMEFPAQSLHTRARERAGAKKNTCQARDSCKPHSERAGGGEDSSVAMYLKSDKHVIWARAK